MKVLHVTFVGEHRFAKCRVTYCGVHNSLYRMEFNSIDYWYVCETHLPIFISDMLSQVFVIQPKLAKPYLTIDAFRVVIQNAKKQLEGFKTFSAHDLEQEIIRQLGDDI